MKRSSGSRAVDASARKSMLLRHGSGGLTHLETKNLWVQETVKSTHIKVCEDCERSECCRFSGMFLCDKHLARSHETHQLRPDRQPGTSSCRSELSLTTPAVTALDMTARMLESVGDMFCPEC